MNWTHLFCATMGFLLGAFCIGVWVAFQIVRTIP